MFKVEHGIAIPGKTKFVKEKRFPLDSLNIGDSFFIPPTVMDEQDTFNDLRSCVVGYAVREDIEITTRIRSENGIVGMRVWRIQKQDKVSK